MEEKKSTLLTIRGMRMLLNDDFRKKVEEDGYDWYADALNYIGLKRRAVRLFNRQKDKQQLAEAIGILRILKNKR